VTRRRKLLLAAAIAIPATVLAVQALCGTRIALALFARKLVSDDPRDRVEARDGLLALGRPAIDPLLPAIVAVNGLDEAASGGAVVVAREVRPDASGLVVNVERVLVATDPRALDPTSKDPDVIRARDERVSPAAARLAALIGPDPVGRGRALVVLGQRDGGPVVRSAVALEGELGTAIEAAAKTEIARRRSLGRAAR
jgi:hypothetical protein